MRRLLVLILVGIVAVQTTGRSADRKTLVSAGDAYITEDPDAESWTIGTDGISVTVALGLRALRATSVYSPYTGEWSTVSGPDTQVTLAGQKVDLGSRNLPFESAETTTYRSGVRLNLTFSSTNPPVRVTRTYVCYPGAPIVEVWTTFEPNGSRSVTAADLNVFDLTIQPGVVRWLSGVEGRAEEGGPFTEQSRELAPGSSMQLGSTSRSSLDALPWLIVDAGVDRFVAGISWSGAWKAEVSRSETGMRVQVGLQPFSTEISGPVETPHGFFGVVGGTRSDLSEALRRFVVDGIREGRDFKPLVIHNSWFAYGTTIDDQAMNQEIFLAADLGVDVYVLDAGWYPNNPDDPWDFTTGLGIWDFDPERFPNGIRALRDLAHEHGIKFGLWVEPERVSLATVNKPYLAKERWLASKGGKYFPDPVTSMPDSAQICLSDPDAWQWVYDRVVEMVELVQPDYLKWDNNAWVNCDRTGHGHGKEDGNFAHVRGLYEMLRTLRQTFPDLIIENCAGGGRRLDFGMLEYSDVGWMDDRTTPSWRVRHNLQGLSSVLPPAYLFSFLMDTEQEPVDPFPGLPFFFRSRMPGVLGMSWRYLDIPDGERESIRDQISVYKSIREIIHDADALMLTQQVPIDGSTDWDVMQEVSSSTGDVLIFAFAAPDASERLTVYPRELDRQALYEVSSVDTGVIAQRTGAQIMDEGVEFTRQPVYTNYILVLRPVGQRPARGAISPH